MFIKTTKGVLRYRYIGGGGEDVIRAVQLYTGVMNFQVFQYGSDNGIHAYHLMSTVVF